MKTNCFSWWLAGVIMLIGNICLFSAIQKEMAPKVEASELLIIDEQQSPRVKVKFENNEPGIQLLDSKGNIRLCILLLEDDPAITFQATSVAGSTMLGLGFEKDDPLLVIIDPKNNPRFGITTIKSASTVVLSDTQGKPQIRLQNEDANSQLDVYENVNGPGFTITNDSVGGK